MSEVSEKAIERLRKSKEEHLTGEREAAREAGREWVLGEEAGAEVEELERLQAASGPFESGGAYSAAEHFVFTICPDNNGSRSAASEFWEWVLRTEEMPSDYFVNAFAEAAIEAWEEVKGKL